MISGLWTFSINAGAAQVASDLGISGLRIVFRANGRDEASFSVDADEALTAASAFAHGDTVIISRGTDRFFYGRVTGIHRAGSSGAETLSVNMEGPSWYLSNTILISSDYYERRDSATGTKAAVPSCKNQFGGYKTKSTFIGGSGWSEGSGSETFTLTDGINAVLDFMTLTRNPAAPFTVGTIDIGASVYVPRTEFKDMTCGDILSRLLAWVPDTVMWFDHSTVPYPTLHIRKNTDLTSESFAIDSGISEAHFEPRADLVQSGVVCFFEWGGNTGTLTLQQLAARFALTQVYPSGVDPVDAGVLSMHIDLESTPGTPDQEQTLYTQPIEEDDVDWWMEKIPWLADGRLSEATVHDSSLLPAGYPHEIIGGTITDWMEDDYGFQSNGVVAKALLDFTWIDGGCTIKKKNVALSISLNAVNKGGGAFVKRGTSGYVEQPPPGLAQRLYEAMSILHYQGSLRWVDNEVGSRATIGKNLRVTGGLASWATMDALVYEVSVNVDSGETECRTGLPAYLSSGQLIELWRANRNGSKPFGGLGADGDESPGVSAVKGPGKVQNTDGTSGEPKLLKWVATDLTDANEVGLFGETGQVVVSQIAGSGPAILARSLADGSGDNFSVDLSLKKIRFDEPVGAAFEVDLTSEETKIVGSAVGCEVLIDVGTLGTKGDPRVELVECLAVKDGQPAKVMVLMSPTGWAP
jgi:hypothetical protein